MYLRILKKDLKRKKTMNVILLIFIILSAMFVSSSVNNIVTVTNALDYYFEKAGMPDYLVATMDEKGEPSISEKLDEIPEIENYGVEEMLFLPGENVFYNNEPLPEQLSSPIYSSIDGAQLNFFDEDNNIIKEVEKGKIYIPAKTLNANGIDVGDTIEIRIEGVSAEFEIAGICKDPVFGADMISNTRFLVNESDFRKFADNEAVSEMYRGSLVYINTDNTDAVAEAMNDVDSVIFNETQERLRITYVMNMVIAGVLLVVSVCLILISFVVLRFTITFTLTEEYREIGVMKAIGISNTKIRALYIMKYLMLSVIGSAIGFLGSIPFANTLLKSVSDSMVLGNDNSIMINILCSIGIIAVILIFCYSCTGKVKRFTPIDAIRNGTTGERFSRKSILRLRGAPVKPSLFMAVNDVLSSPKRFSIVIVTYTLCLSLVLILVNTINTLKSGDLAYALGTSKTDIYFYDTEAGMEFWVEDGKEKAEEKLAEIEQTFADNEMPGKAMLDIMLKINVRNGDKSHKSTIYQGIGSTTDMYRYFEGTPPENENEIALTSAVAEKLDVTIGDTVTICHISGDRDYIVTAFFQSMNSMGEGVRLHEDADVDFSQANGFFPFQFDFDDNPDEDEIRSRIEKVEEILNLEVVMTADEFVEDTVGVAEMINSVKMLVLALVIVIIILVTVLMERSFITKERGEIAIMKAIGFRSSSIISWHTARFGIVSVISTVISLILNVPLTDISVGPVFEMMGANYGVEYKIVPFEAYVIYPLIVLGITILSALFTSLYTRKIVASEASGIE